MSFFDEPKNFGLAMVIVGLITAIAGVVLSVEELINSDDKSWEIILGGIGYLIYGMMVVGMGTKVRNGEISKKIQLLGQFIAVAGAGFFVTFFFVGIGLSFDGTWATGIARIVVGIILAIIVCLIARMIMDESATTISKIVWIVLLVLFILMAIGNFIGVFTAFTGDAEILHKILASVSSICNAVIYLFLFITLLSEDVKKGMGI